MFFRDGERIIIKAAHPVYERYNQLSRGICANKVGEVQANNFYRKEDTRFCKGNIAVSFSLWRLVDKNTNAAERGVDTYNHFTVVMPDRRRIAYAVVPQMNTDCSDKYPCEWTEEKGGLLRT